MSYVFNIWVPLGLHISPQTIQTAVVSVEPICLSEVMSRVTLTRDGRLRVSVRGHVILDSYSEPSGALYQQRRANKTLSKVFGTPNPGARLFIKPNKPKDTNHE